MKAYFRFFLGLLIFQILMSCQEERSPEMVVREWLAYRSAGECEKALDLEYYSGEEIRTILNCEPFKLEIVSLLCDLREETADCKCLEIRGDEKEKQYSYDLKKIDGEWIITAFN